MRELPEVASPRPGVWSIPVPIPGSSLGWVFVYALVGETGTWLVDAGWDTPESREALEAGLVTAGTSLREVDAVLVTHVHADHFGLAGWIREHSDAWVAMHPADTAQVHDRYVDPEALLGRGDAWLRSAGVPEDVVAELGAPHALPGHVHPFDTPADRARELQAGHAEELEHVLETMADGATTAWEVATGMPWARPRQVLPAFDRRAAVSEVGAHLVRLEDEGRVACDRSRDVHAWWIVDG